MPNDWIKHFISLAFLSYLMFAFSTEELGNYLEFTATNDITEA